jgi:hypothetical protein
MVTSAKNPNCTNFEELTLKKSGRTVVPSRKSLVEPRQLRDPFTSNPTERRDWMFTRIVELTAKTGKQRQLTRVVHDKGVPILKKQTGFLDEIVLNSDTEPERVVSVSF